jgi:hypothetical protein
MSGWTPGDGRKYADTTWRHVKTGGHYTVVDEGLIEATKAPVIIYRSDLTGQVWVRPKAEFLDGRFESRTDGYEF